MIWGQSKRERLLRFRGFDQLLQSRFGTRCRIAVNHVASAGSVKLFRTQAKIGIGFFDIARSDGFTYVANSLANDGLDSAVSVSLDGILTQSFFGTKCIWHGS